jgi:hypothetical protein
LKRMSRRVRVVIANPSGEALRGVAICIQP